MTTRKNEKKLNESKLRVDPKGRSKRLSVNVHCVYASHSPRLILN